MNSLFQTQVQNIKFQVLDERPKDNFYEVNQIHSNKIVSVQHLNEEADGIIIQKSEYNKNTLAIKTADCVALALIGDNGSALIHAGWRGIHQNIHLDQKLLDLNIHTGIIGPSIKNCCFEVTSEFKNYFPNSHYFSTKNEKIYFNLQSKIINDLQEKWKDIKIIDSQVCTCCDLNYHSYRRNATTQRNWNLLLLPE